MNFQKAHVVSRFQHTFYQPHEINLDFAQHLLALSKWTNPSLEIIIHHPTNWHSAGLIVQPTLQLQSVNDAAGPRLPLTKIRYPSASPAVRGRLKNSWWSPPWLGCPISGRCWAGLWAEKLETPGGIPTAQTRIIAECAFIIWLELFASHVWKEDPDDHR